VNSHGKVNRPPAKAVMLFDGDCGFCQRWIQRWGRSMGQHVDFLPLQAAEIAERFPELSRAAMEDAVHLVEPSGRVSRGAEAVFRSWLAVRRWPLWLYEHVPGADWAAELGYQFIARRRGWFSRMDCGLFRDAGCRKRDEA
jgi:predicted DCC family thiol-disulfide oxidoreductase YuxK